MAEETSGFWKKCSNCKKEISLGAVYYRCSVSTCNHERTGLQFCSVSCWSSHVPIYRHRDAWAIEETAPARAISSGAPALVKELIDDSSAANPVIKNTPAKFLVARTPSAEGASSLAPAKNENEILVVVSKLKSYIRERSDMNTSADVMEVLSDLLRRQCDEAIRRARSDGRKTVMGRDF